MLNLLPIFTYAAATGCAGTPPSDQIVLKPSMLVNECAYGEIDALVDEQSADKSHPPTKPFFPGWTGWQYPISVAIDLGGRCQVKDITIYNETSENPIILSTGVPFAWKDMPVTLGGYQQWNEFAINANTRWLRLTLTRPTNISELIVHGTRLDTAPPKPVAKAKRQQPTVDQFMGTNAFIDDPIDKIATPGGFVREYHSWAWDVEGVDGRVRFQPSAAAGGNSWFFDDYYQKLKAAGVTVSPVLQQTPERLLPVKKGESKPLETGANSENPLSYKLHAKHLFQYAARYGSTKVADSLLDLAPGQPRKSGLGYLSYLENWNEPDKTWEGREGRFNPYDLAAMSSADYDGHQGKMGKTVGVKNADPKMRLVLGGLAGLNLDFVRAIKFWADYNRGGSFPADVINLHHYSSSSNEQWFQPNGKGISPEDDHLREKMQAISNWRDANVPDRELWLTEFGYDTNPQSPLHVPVVGSMTPEQVQASWLIRAYMALAAAGVDRAAMFMLRNTENNGTGVFATCGIVGEKGDWKPKAAYYYMATLKNQLKGYRFSKVLSSVTDPVWRYEFAKPNGQTAVVVWCPTSLDKHIDSYSLPVTGSKARVVSFSETSTTGKVADVKVESSRVSIPVSETPKIVLSGG